MALSALSVWAWLAWPDLSAASALAASAEARG
jgi:hypothetical protein